MIGQPLSAEWRLSTALALVVDGRVDVNDDDGNWIVPPDRSGTAEPIRWAPTTADTLDALLRNQLIYVQPQTPAQLTRLGRRWLTDRLHHELEGAW